MIQPAVTPFHRSAKVPQGVVWAAGSAQLKALQAAKISRRSINQELITLEISTCSPRPFTFIKWWFKHPKDQNIWEKWGGKFFFAIRSELQTNDRGQQVEWFHLGEGDEVYMDKFQVLRISGPIIGFHRHIYIYSIYLSVAVQVQSIWTSIINIWQLSE